MGHNKCTWKFPSIKYMYTGTKTDRLYCKHKCERIINCFFYMFIHLHTHKLCPFLLLLMAKVKCIVEYPVGAYNWGRTWMMFRVCKDASTDKYRRLRLRLRKRSYKQENGKRGKDEEVTLIRVKQDGLMTGSALQSWPVRVLNLHYAILQDLKLKRIKFQTKKSRLAPPTFPWMNTHREAYLCHANIPRCECGSSLVPSYSKYTHPSTLRYSHCWINSAPPPNPTPSYNHLLCDWLEHGLLVHSLFPEYFL